MVIPPALLVAATVLAAGDPVPTGSYVSEFYHHQVTGAIGRSFLIEGEHARTEVNMKWTGRSETTAVGPVDWTLGYNVRFTDDTQVDRNPGHVLSAFLEAKGVHGAHPWMFTGGEQAIQYTPYTFAAPLQGAHLSYAYRPTGTLRLTGGRRLQNEDNRNFDRYAFGVQVADRIRLESGPLRVLRRLAGDAIEAKVQFVSTEDDRGSLITGFEGAARDQGSRVGSIALEGRSPFLLSPDPSRPVLAPWTLEVARSRGHVDARRPGPQEDGLAAKWTYTLPLRNLQYRNEYEYVTRDFLTFSGFAPTDIFRRTWQATANFTPAVSLTARYILEYNDVEDSSTFARQVSRTPFAQLSWRPFSRRADTAPLAWFLNDLAVSATYDARTTRAEDLSTDREVRSWRVGLTDKFWGIQWSLDHSVRTTDDRRLGDPTADRRDRFTNLTASGTWKVWKRDLRWTYRYSYQEVLSFGAAARAPLGQFDRTILSGLSWNVDLTDRLRWEGSVDLTDVDRQRGGTDSQRRIYASYLKYAIGGDLNRVLFYRYRREEDRDDNAGREFREVTHRLGLEQRF